MLDYEGLYKVELLYMFLYVIYNNLIKMFCKFRGIFDCCNEGSKRKNWK